MFSLFSGIDLSFEIYFHSLAAQHVGSVCMGAHDNMTTFLLGIKFRSGCLPHEYSENMFQTKISHPSVWYKPASVV